MNHSKSPSPSAPHAGPLRGVSAFGILSVFVLAGCGGTEEAPTLEDAADTASEVPVNRLTTLEYADSLGVDFEQMQSTPAGLYYRDVVVGTGAEAATGNGVTVHYVGFFPNGSSFDSSREREVPFEITLGAGQVIQGWEQGIPGMKVGGRRTLVLPPELAYGAGGHPAGIPPNAVLVFDVELLEVN